MALRKEKTRMFDGQKYERVGQSPARTPKQIRELKSWANFQRRVNNRNVRIVKEGDGYEAYISTAKRGKPVKTTARWAATPKAPLDRIKTLINK